MLKNLFYSIQVQNIIENIQQSIQQTVLLRRFQFTIIKIDWLTISAIFILGYALLRSGIFLLFYLIMWNIYPPSQFIFIFNPIAYESYLLILSFFLAWYSIRLLFEFPKQFQIHLWLFQQIKMEQLSTMAKSYVGFNTTIFEGFLYLSFIWIIILFPHFSVYFIWWLTLTVELYCFLTIRKPQILLYNPTWIALYTDIIEGPQKKSNDVQLVEEHLQIPMHEDLGTQYSFIDDHENNVVVQVAHPHETGISQDEFEYFFCEQTFIPPVHLDIYEDEFSDGWVNWFWLNWWYKCLPLLLYLNLLIFILFCFFGIPENWIQDMRITYINMEQFLYNYQNTIFHINNTTWTTSCKWLLGGLGFRAHMSFFTKMYNNTSTTDRHLILFLDELKQYNKYIYYIFSKHLKEAKIYNELFPFYYWYLQIYAFFYKARQYPHDLRNTYFYKNLLYYDFKLFAELKESFFSKYFGSNAKSLLKWLIKRSSTWVDDYYYVAPAINIYPERYYFWLNLVRLLFVIEELQLTIFDTHFTKFFFFKDTQRHFNSEVEKFFLQEFVENKESIEQNFSYLVQNEPTQQYKFFTGLTNFHQTFSFFMYLLLKNRIKNRESYDDYGFVLADLSQSLLTNLDLRQAILGDEHPLARIEKTNFFLQPNAEDLESLMQYVEKNQEVLDSDMLLRKLKINIKPRYQPRHLYELDDIINEGDDFAYEALMREFKTSYGKYELGTISYYNYYYARPILKILEDSKEIKNTFFHYLREFIIFIARLKNEKEKVLTPTYYDFMAAFSSYSDSINDIINEKPRLSSYAIQKYQGNYDYDILNNLNYSTNLDIVPLLREDLQRELLLDTDLQAYIFRDDVKKMPQRRRIALTKDLFQLFSYLKAHRTKASLRRSRLYDPSGIYNPALLNFELSDSDETFFIEQVTLALLNEQTLFFSSDIFNQKYLNYYPISLLEEAYYPYGFSSEALRKAISDFSQTKLSLNEETQINFTDIQSINQSKLLQDLLWYRYYYKVDSALNYYDLMPSYQKFYMKTWPCEYLSSTYNFYGKIDTIDYSTIKQGVVENGFLVYNFSLNAEKSFLQYLNKDFFVDPLYLYFF